MRVTVMNLPNKLSMFRIVLVPVIACIYLFTDLPEAFGADVSGEHIAVSMTALLVLILFAIASFTDYLDGHIARKHNLITSFGKFIDPIADKLLVNTMFILFAVDGVVPAVFVLIMIWRDMIVDGLRMNASAKGKVVAAGMMGKAKTVLQMFAIIFLLLNNLPFAFVSHSVLCGSGGVGGKRSGVFPEAEGYRHGDNVNMKALIERLKKDRLTIGSCESLTAGLFASTIAEVSGASAVLKGGIVTYWTECKVNVVHVREEIVKKYGVVSAPCAKEMAEKARLLLDVDLCVSFSGNAGPDTMEGKPAGLVYCAIADRHRCEVYEFHLTMERNALRKKLVEEMGKQVIRFLDAC